MPYALTNCHNSLCAVGGTINEDDHVFGLSAAKKYGGIFVPANQAVIHQYMREMIRGLRQNDPRLRQPHPLRRARHHGRRRGRAGAGQAAAGNTYDVAMPDVVLVYLTGRPRRGVGPHDVAIALMRRDVPARGLSRTPFWSLSAPA
jgi:aconitate hydratase